MATSVRDLSYGAVEIYTEESDTLGVGSYGKVCKAKCGQLPCAAKLLHDTMFGTNDPGVRKFVEQFKQECQFLRAIKHPNIVQFLGTSRDPRSRRLALLMELMDESLTRFLERSTGPLPYHTQFNICQDVALALAYLHSNDIIHRDLSSNNVLLIGEGIRAKVTDFGMSKLEGMNPRMTPLTMCPGTSAYMPPEALVKNPRYSSNLDCFSHGVLAIQIATRQFPNPGDPTITVEDLRSPTKKIEIPIAEYERRKKDIDLVAPDHPLLPLALHCLKDIDTERPSADELCGRLATLKREPRYTHSVEQSREQNMSLQVQTLQQQLQEKDERARAELQQQLQEKDNEFARARSIYETGCQQQLQEKDCELEMVREELKANELATQQTIEDCHAALEAKTVECDKKLAESDKKLCEKDSVIEQLRKENYELRQQPPMKMITADLAVDRQPDSEHVRKANKEYKSNESAQPHKSATLPSMGHRKLSIEKSSDLMDMKWRQGMPVPCITLVTSNQGTAVVHGNNLYLSCDQILLYEFHEDKWMAVTHCEYEDSGLAIVSDKLTTVGGRKGTTATNVLLSLSHSPFETEQKLEQLLPPMPTARIRPAAITTSTHLVIAGGRAAKISDDIFAVEILDLNTLQWSSACDLPEELIGPHFSLCNGSLYLSKNFNIFSCSLEELLKSCKPPFSSASDSSGGSVWTRLSIPDSVRYGASLATLRGHVLAIGGSDGGNPTGAIHCYDDRSTNSWSVIGEMPTPRYDAIVAVLPSNELIVLGGREGREGMYNYCYAVEIAQISN